MTKQEVARICFKYGKIYPKAFPAALQIAEENYKADRIERGVE